MTTASGATVVDGASPGSTGLGPSFSTTKISERWPRAAEKRNAAPATSSDIAKGDQHPTEDGDRTQVPDEERVGVPSKRTLRGY